MHSFVRALCALLLMSMLVSNAAFGANRGIIHGSVRDYQGAFVPKVKVTLVARNGRVVDEHETDAEGHFEFEQVPFGTYKLAVLAPDGRADTQQASVSSGDVVELEIFLPILGQVVNIESERPKAPLPGKTAASTSTLEREDIKVLPRGDTASVNEILATQPGFVYDAMGNLFARGNHANIQYQIDGVPLPDSVSGMFGGFLSPKLVENMEVITGGLGAEYGQRLSAVVNLNARRPSDAGAGELEVQGGSYSTISPSIVYAKRFGALSATLGGSFKRTDRALDPQAPSPILHDSGDEQRVFGRIEYELTEHTGFTLLGAFARNFYRVPIDPNARAFDASLPNGGRTPDQFGNDPAPFFPADTRSNETERDAFGILSFHHDASAKASFRAAVSYRNSYGLLFGDAGHALGPSQDPCVVDDQGNQSCPTASDVKRQAHHIGGFAEQLLRFGDTQVLRIGAQVDQLFGVTDYTSYTRSDSLNGPDPSLTVSGSDRSNATTGGAYVQHRATLGRFVVNAGLRFDFQRVSFQGDPTTSFDVGIGPRLGIAYAVNETTVLHVYGGLLWQPPPVLDAPAAARILGLLQPGQNVSYDLAPEKDRYAEIGIESRVIPELSLKLTGWGRLSTDQLDDIGVGSTNLLSPYNFREGRAGGLEAGATLVLGGLRAFGNLSLTVAQGRDIKTAQYLFSPEDLANHEWQTLDHAQTWTGNGGLAYRLGFTQASALLTYGSGLRTGPLNTQHVPGAARLDLSLSHQFFEWPLKPSVSLDVVNVLDAEYAYRIANGFNGSHYAPGRSIYLRLGALL